MERFCWPMNMRRCYKGVHTILEEHFEVVVMAADQNSLLTTLDRLQPEVAVVDVAFSRVMTNASAMLQDLFPRVKVVDLSLHDESVVVERVLSLGAGAFVLKRSAVTDLPATIADVFEGWCFVPAAAQYSRQS